MATDAVGGRRKKSATPSGEAVENIVHSPPAGVRVRSVRSISVSPPKTSRTRNRSIRKGKRERAAGTDHHRQFTGRPLQLVARAFKRDGYRPKIPGCDIRAVHHPPKSSEIPKEPQRIS